MVLLIIGQSSVYTAAMDVVNSAENLSFESTDLIEKLNDFITFSVETVTRSVSIQCTLLHVLYCTLLHSGYNVL